jgi:hypothetical protein
MTNTDHHLKIERHSDGYALAWELVNERSSAELLFRLAFPLVLETTESDSLTLDGQRHHGLYQQCQPSEGAIVGLAELTASGSRYRLEDRWFQVDELTWRVDRQLEIVALERKSGFRLLLELSPASSFSSYDDFHYFAPPALYDLNDLDQDGLEDYLETRSLAFREDRLNMLTLLAYHEQRSIGIALSRADPPEFDPRPERARGQNVFFQRTDIGSLGIRPEGMAPESLTIFAAYPFVERDRSHALLVSRRTPWGAFWPVSKPETISVSYVIQLTRARNVHRALWEIWRGRFRDLKPHPVSLPASFEAITNTRIEAMLEFYREESEPPYAAGFVTNCHPQDGKQISNVIQYGFTGQNTLNALILLRAITAGSVSREHRSKALKVCDFFVKIVDESRVGLSYGLYNFDTKRFGSWWTGLLLPLAYAEPGHGLEDLMGPLYQHLQPVIEGLRSQNGMYLRCAAEEYDSLLRAHEHERQNGVEHDQWKAACLKFGNFLLATQQPDGSWVRAYTFEGKAIEQPAAWFGQNDVQRKSSTATVIPFLLSLYKLTEDQQWLTAAVRAGNFVQDNYIDQIKFNGGVHDSLYVKPQLIDGESIMFACKALWQLYQTTAEEQYLEATIRAAQLVVTWVCLWDVPLPVDSTLATFGFRSTGWMACDSPAAGYVHPMGLLAVPELVEIGLETGVDVFLTVAELIQAGCNETVSLPQKDWGNARSGLQEEGLLISWWFADDPIFNDTAFGGRGKGEGNKTCLPWITAVAVDSYQQLRKRYGTSDIKEIRGRFARSSAHNVEANFDAGKDFQSMRT